MANQPPSSWKISLISLFYMLKIVKIAYGIIMKKTIYCGQNKDLGVLIQEFSPKDHSNLEKCQKTGQIL